MDCGHSAQNPLAGTYAALVPTTIADPAAAVIAVIAAVGVLFQLSAVAGRGAGGLLGNLPAVHVGADVSARLSKGVRSTALTFILTRAGLGVDLDMLRRHAAPCAQLALLPSTVEACTAAVLARALLEMDWVWCAHSALRSLMKHTYTC